MTDLFQETKNLLAQKGWCQDEYISYDGKMCLVGGVDVASGAFVEKEIDGYKVMVVAPDVTPAKLTLRNKGVAILAAVIRDDGLERYLSRVSDIKAILPPDDGDEENSEYVTVETEFGALTLGLGSTEGVENWNDKFSEHQRTVDEVVALLDKASAEHGHLVPMEAS
jgi:hypothetical protein